MDSRMRRVLQELARHDSPTLATKLFTIHDAPLGVIAGHLNNAHKLGLCTKIDISKAHLKLWVITPAGIAELAKPD